MIFSIHIIERPDRIPIDNFIRALKKFDHKVVLVTNIDSELSTERGDHFYVCNFDPNHYQQEILEIVKKHQVDLVLSNNDWALEPVSFLSAHLGYTAFTARSARTATDKWQSYEFAISENIPMLKSALLKDLNDFDREELQGFPVVIKPSFSTGRIEAEGFDYTFHSDIQALKLWLREKDFLDRLLALNKIPDFFGCRLLQRALDFKDHLNVNVAIIQGQVHSLLMNHIFYDRKFTAFEVAAGGPALITENLRSNILKTIQKYVDKLEIKNSFACFQFLVDDNLVCYPNDIHLRLGETFSMMMSRFHPEILNECVQGFLGRPFSIPPFEGHFFKGSFDLEPGKIRSVTLPDSKKFGVELYNMHKIQPGQVVPEQSNYDYFDAYFLIRDSVSLENCKEKARQFKMNIHVEYEANLSSVFDPLRTNS